ncbi:hypothetical protein ACLMJK_006971 [Lecanora helva]
MASTMKEAHVSPDTSVTIHEVPIPQIEHPSQMLVKVVVSGTNPKDWKMPAGILLTIGDCPNSGDDVAGVVSAVGSEVTDFRVGDRVAALHELGTRGGSYAEYSLVWDWATFHLADHITFEEAATVPMAAMMASISIFGMLEVVPSPWNAISKGHEKPLVVYGAAGAVGAFAVKLAKLFKVGPVICIAGRGIPFVKSLIGDGDVVIDYRKGDEAMVHEVQEALRGKDLMHAFDAVSEKGSFINLSRVLARNGRLNLVLPYIRDDVPDHIEQSTTMAGSLWRDLTQGKVRGEVGKGQLGLGAGGKDFGFVFMKLVGKWLNEGTLKPHPHEVVDGGLEGVETALKALRAGKASAVKYVVRITEGPESKA